LTQHQGRNNSKKLYEYKERGKTFVKGLYLTERPISSTGEKQFKCEHCG
ncbi:hypothetical protein DBR06_SOUSAS610075, partial [Sousa chinensis]